MYLLIDAYNLLKFKHQKTCISEQERFNFINSFNKYNLNNKDQVFIVFDGGYNYFRTEEKLGRANIVFAGFNKSADDELIILAQKFRNGCLLVTNDNELKKTAASYGAKNISVNLFISIASKFEQVKLSNNKKTIVLKIIKEVSFDCNIHAKMNYDVNNPFKCLDYDSSNRDEYCEDVL